MDILYTIEEKYLQAVEELRYGELPKALNYFNEIINIDPEYARAYYQLGCFYHYQFKNYQTAGYYYKRCIELEAGFPDVYEHYLKLLIELNMKVSVQQTAKKALLVAGVCKACIFNSLGLFAEEQQDFNAAKEHYRKAALITVSQTEHSEILNNLERIRKKQNGSRQMIYAYEGAIA